MFECFVCERVHLTVQYVCTYVYGAVMSCITRFPFHSSMLSSFSYLFPIPSPFLSTHLTSSLFSPLLPLLPSSSPFSPLLYSPLLPSLLLLHLSSSPWSGSSAQPTSNGDFLLDPGNPFSIDELEAALPPLQPSDSGEGSNQVSGWE